MRLFRKREPKKKAIQLFSMDRASQWTLSLLKVNDATTQASISIDGYMLLSAERQSVRTTVNLQGQRASENELGVISDTKTVLDDLYNKASSPFGQSNGGFSETFGDKIFNVLLETMPDIDGYCYQFGLRFERVTQSQFSVTNTLYRISNVLGGC
jgi:hypothetical protein